jgi:DNA-binding response OmpR family regulator
MSKGRVVVIENDDWIARLLEEGLNDAGYEVILSSEALEGLQRAQEKLPDCIICDVALPDFDGYWVAHKVRADSSAISTTPFLFLTQADDESSPLEAFNVGADVQLTKPFRLDEVVAQVGALVEMAKRLRKTRDSFLDKKAQPPLGEALRGDLAQMSLATVLALLEMERRSGQLQVSEGDGNSGSTATIDLASGFATGGTLGGASAGLLQILREIMKWKSGLLIFHVGKEAPPPNPRRPIGAILMEAVQLNATGPTPPQLVAKMAAARAAMQKGGSMSPKAPSVLPPVLPKVPAPTKVAPPQPGPFKAKAPLDPKKQ